MSRSPEPATRREGALGREPSGTVVRSRETGPEVRPGRERMQSLPEWIARAEAVLASVDREDRVARLLRVAVVRRDLVLLKNLLRPWWP